MNFSNLCKIRFPIIETVGKKLIFSKNDNLDGPDIGTTFSYDTNIFISVYSANKNESKPFKNYYVPCGYKSVPATNYRFRFIFKTTKINVCSFRAYTCHDKIALLSNVDNLQDYIIDGEKQRDIYLRWKMDFSKLPKNFELIVTDSRTNQFLGEITYMVTDDGFIKSSENTEVDDNDYILYHLYNKDEYWDD